MRILITSWKLVYNNFRWSKSFELFVLHFRAQLLITGSGQMHATKKKCIRESYLRSKLDELRLNVIIRVLYSVGFNLLCQKSAILRGLSDPGTMIPLSQCCRRPRLHAANYNPWPLPIVVCNHIKSIRGETKTKTKKQNMRQSLAWNIVVSGDTHSFIASVQRARILFSKLKNFCYLWESRKEIFHIRSENCRYNSTGW